MSRRKSKTGEVEPSSGEPVLMDELGRPLEAFDVKIHEDDDANDPAILDKRRKAETRRLRNDARVIQSLMETREGRDWFYRKLTECHIYDTGTDLGTETRPSDPYKTYFLNGERNVGHRLLADVQHAAPDLYMVMLSEQKQKKEYNGD